MRRCVPTARFAIVAIVALTVLAACNGDGSTSATPTSDAIQPPPGPTVLEPTNIAPFEGTRGPEELQALYPEVAYLSDVRTGRHDEGFDRVTFEFEGGATGYRIEYVDPPITEDPSDLPVDIDGNAFLRVVFFSASAVDLSTETPRITCLIPGMAAGLMLSSVTPRPRSMRAATGSEAISPQTPTRNPRREPAATTPRIIPRIAGWSG